MMGVLAFVALAVIGTLIRAVVTASPAAGQIPWRTLGINCIGAFALGAVMTSQLGHAPVAVTVAGLGSLTTFSTVAGETAALLDDGHKRTAILYVGLTLVVGVASAWLGLSIGERL
jgi:CrcB protein